MPAPIITIGALSFIAFLPDPPISGAFPFVNFAWLKSEFTAMPIQIFNWISRPDQAFQQNAAASIFAFFSPTDADFHLRPRLSWNATDRWSVTVGADVCAGRHGYTMFGQFKNDNQLFARLRYGF